MNEVLQSREVERRLRIGDLTGVEGSTMLAAVYHGQEDIRIEEVSIPVPGAGEVLIRVTAAGICGTDASEYLHGPDLFPSDGRHPHSGHQGPMIMGHEFAGVVVDVGEGVDSDRIGRLVVCGAGVSCGKCRMCAVGRTNLCERYYTLGLQANGGLAQYCVAPDTICVQVESPHITGDVAGLGQPMAVGNHAMKRGALAAGDSAVVIGVGGIGAFVIFAAVQAGARVLAVDVRPERLDIARALGAQLVVDAHEDVASMTGDLENHPRVVYEVSGTPAGLELANSLLVPGGRMVVIGLQEGISDGVDLRRLALQELEWIGTNAHACDPDVGEAIELLSTNVAVWDLVAPEVLPLDLLVEDGLIPMIERRASRLKTLIDPWAETPRQLRTSSRM